MQNQRISHIYNPANQSKNELIENFIIREEEFKDIVKEIKALDSQVSHFLIEGQRGVGKTSLMLRVKYEIESNPEFITVQFAEEQYNIFDLCRLWESIAEDIEEVEGFEDLSEKLEEISEDENYSEKAYPLVESYLQKNQKRLILFIDNFGDILDRFTPKELEQLKRIFTESKSTLFITSTSKELEYIENFFEKFKKIELDGLDKSETDRLLKQLASDESSKETIDKILKNEPERVEVIRQLTGGIPRTIVLLFEIFLDESASIFEDLEMILDRVTPLYKHRMDDLPKQQQAIVDAMAMNWDGIGSREIVEALKNRGFDSKKVSAQLKFLEKNSFIISKLVDKKNKIYFIKERFLNIWYLMRYGRKKQKNQVKWLVKFLQEWCSPEEIERRVKRHIECAKDGTLHPKGGFYMTEALAPLIKDFHLQHEFIEESKNHLKQFDTQIDKKLSKSNIDIFNKATEAYEKNNFNLAIKLFLKLEKSNNSEILFILAFLYNKTENYKEAEKYYKLAINNGNIDAMNHLAISYDKTENYKEAEKYYKLAIDNGNTNAMNNLAILYEKKFKNYIKAKEYYKLAIENENIDAMSNLALLYEYEFKNYEKAEKYYKLAIANGNINTLFKIVIFYLEQKREKEYLESIEKIKDILIDIDYEKDYKAIEAFLLILLINKKYKSVNELFQVSNRLKEVYKPIYYALMVVLKDEYPKEYLKMGSELKQSVNETLEYIESDERV